MEDDHSISAFYASDGERYQPVLACSCGFESSRGLTTWEEAGAEMDEHVKEAKGQVNGQSR